jgi:SEC-C motif-containing protein
LPRARRWRTLALVNEAEPCPCGSGEIHGRCCGPVIAGTAPARTAEALMRSRYTAYATGAIDHIAATEDARDVDREATARWARRRTWTGLEIVGTEGGGEADEEGVVEFRAHYRELHEGHGHEHDHVHHERSRFRRRDGRWLYRDAVPPDPVTAGPRIGRNDPCPCGSGKKYKKCHGA